MTRFSPYFIICLFLFDQEKQFKFISGNHYFCFVISEIILLKIFYKVWHSYQII